MASDKEKNEVQKLKREIDDQGRIIAFLSNCLVYFRDNVVHGNSSHVKKINQALSWRGE